MTQRTYVHTNAAWYSDASRRILDMKGCIEEIYFLTDEPFGEMAMRWYDVGGEMAPRLEVFVQSAEALSSLTDVLASLAQMSKNGHDKELSPQMFCQLLQQCGFTDKTPYKYEDSYPNETKQ